jgi:T-complex protein 1 subunit delta
VNFRALIAGGGAPEIELALRLTEYSRTLSGMESYCVRAFADAMEVIPSTLAENAGLNPISTVTELRNRHAQGEKTTGINVRKVIVLVLRVAEEQIGGRKRLQFCHCWLVGF